MEQVQPHLLLSLTGKTTDINISNFGSEYSAANPPTVVIQSPPQARASVEPGLNEVTGVLK